MRISETPSAAIRACSCTVPLRKPFATLMYSVVLLCGRQDRLKRGLTLSKVLSLSIVWFDERELREYARGGRMWDQFGRIGGNDLISKAYRKRVGHSMRSDC